MGVAIEVPLISSSAPSPVPTTFPQLLLDGSPSERAESTESPTQSTSGLMRMSPV